MAKITMTEAPEFVVFPANSILLLKVDDVQVREVQGKKGTWEKLEFTFIIKGVQDMGDGSDVSNGEAAIGSKIWGGCGATLTDNPENKLRQWTEAILGMELSVGFELDTDLLIGRECRGITSIYQKKTGFDGHQIDALLPKGGATPKPAEASVGVAELKAATVAADPWQTDEPPF